MRKNKKNSLAFRRKIPVAGCFDVVVCGGGPAGFSAAAAAARAGMNTLLIERFNCLGGAGTVGLVGPFAPTDGTNGGVYREILQRLAAEKSLKSSWYYRIPNCFDAETYKYAAQTLCEEAGVHFLFDTMVSDVIMRRREIEGVVVANKGGLQAVFGQVTIDATGDGDIAWMAGAPYEKGDRKGRCQPTTFFFNIGGIRPVKLTARDVLNIKRAYRRALREGAIHLPRHMDNIWSWTDFIGEGSTIRAAETSINIDMTSGMDGTDPEALSKAEADGRRQAWECLRFFRKNIPGAEKAYITQTNLLYGLRETRRIRGEYYLTKADIIRGRKFADGICKGSFNIDIHGRKNKKHKYSWQATRCLPEGDWYEIPYRCLVPQKVERLLVAGRCVSCDREALGSLRIQPVCMALGQAAGAAAALAVLKKTAPRRLNGSEIRRCLRDSGADI